jgi:hypothetical protein
MKLKNSWYIIFLGSIIIIALSLGIMYIEGLSTEDNYKINNQLNQQMTEISDNQKIVNTNRLNNIQNKSIDILTQQNIDKQNIVNNQQTSKDNQTADNTKNKIT